MFVLRYSVDVYMICSRLTHLFSISISNELSQSLLNALNGYSTVLMGSAENGGFRTLMIHSCMNDDLHIWVISYLVFHQQQSRGAGRLG